MIDEKIAVYADIILKCRNQCEAWNAAKYIFEHGRKAEAARLKEVVKNQADFTILEPVKRFQCNRRRTKRKRKSQTTLRELGVPNG